MQSADARREVLLLVVDGDHYVEDRRTGVSGREVLPRRQGAGRRVGSHGTDFSEVPCRAHVVALCCACECGGRTRPGSGRAAAGPSAGRRTVNTVRPGTLSTVTAPPCAAATACTMASPSPVDPVARDRAESPRANRSEDVRQQLRRDPRPIVLHVDAHPRSAPLHACGDRRTGRRVVAGVAQQVDQHLLQPGRVRRHRRRLVGQVEPPGVVHAGRAGVADGVHDERDEIGLLELQRAPGVQPGEQQQILDQQGHPPRLGLDPAERVPGVGPHLLPPAPGEFRVAPDGGERCPQLVAGVGDEPPDPGLALLPGVQGAVHVVQHPVERGTDPADLGVRVALRLRHPLAQPHLTGVQRQLGDPGRGGGDLAERPGGDADQHVPGDAGGDETGSGDADLDQDQGVDVVVGVLGGQADVEGFAAVPARLVRDEVVPEPGDLHGVRGAVLRHRAERLLLRGVQAVGPGPLEEAVVVVLLPGDGRAGDRGVRHVGGDRAERGGPLRQQVLHLAARGGGGVRHLGRRAGPAVRFPEMTDRAHRDLGDLAFQLVVEVTAQGEGGHRADHGAHHGDQRHGRDDEPGPQGARLRRPSPPPPRRTRPPSPAHDAAGLIR